MSRVRVIILMAFATAIAATAAAGIGTWDRSRRADHFDEDTNPSIVLVTLVAIAAGTVAFTAGRALAIPNESSETSESTES